MLTPTERKRQGYIHELIVTEENYVNDLQLVTEVRAAVGAGGAGGTGREGGEGVLCEGGLSPDSQPEKFSDMWGGIWMGNHIGDSYPREGGWTLIHGPLSHLDRGAEITRAKG